ncbi:putative ABC transport system permease protein [Chitinophaga sp. CF118]|uniref:ABC transporter permease n=1 Tax=Chitinophaga sp. CF118 TaxID=1884367 RepID=UPI0008F3D494|nr:ABC transporter permease [Chitinophaga sp. CF118]SFD50024.1 putative ABC transport system permease protein [Chitinophaga sp. CF118]
MLKNYFKIAFRNLWRKKTFSFINVTGLAVGMTSCLLIFLYVHFELSYDRFNSKADRIYRVVGDLKSSAGTLHWYNTPGPMAGAMKAQFPEVQETVRLVQGSILVRKDNIKFQEEHSLWADASIFTVFDFPMKSGDAKTALKEPNSIVFSETAARKYFGNANPVGQSLLLSGKNIPVIVTGIMKDIPENSHIKADMLISMSTYSTSFVPWVETDWDVFNPSTYLLLAPGAKSETLQSKLPAFFQKYAGDVLKKNNMSYSAKLEPLEDVYLHSAYGGMETGNLNNVTIFTVIALFILLIAAVNFINLTTARSVERAKEVGIRKCAGAVKNQLLLQFLIESIVIALISWLLAIFLCQLLLPMFNVVSGKIISTGIFVNASYPLGLLGLALGIGLLAGIYPAVVLSSFKPITVLKGSFASGNKGIVLRKVLVVTQFTISITLIVSTLVVYSQLNFMRNRSLGFDKDRVLVISNNGDPGTIDFKKQISDIPSIQSSSISSAIPGRDYNDGNNDMGWVQIQNSKDELQRVNINIYNVDEDFLHVYKIKLLAGRGFSNAFPADSANSVILNKTTVRKLGYVSYQQIIGERFVTNGYTRTVVGVVDDFHFHSLKEPIQPLCLLTGRGYWQFISMKVTTGNLPATINALQNKWGKAIPNRPFNYFFLDEDFNNQYQAEDKFGHLFSYFSILSIFISSLGLLGLASYSTLQRTREIGIRKVLGASVSSIISLLSKDFVMLVFISFLIACPLSWFAMNRWLQEFAFRITMSLEIFLLAGAGALLVALFTISFQSIKAALRNPVKSLRTE